MGGLDDQALAKTADLSQGHALETVRGRVHGFLEVELVRRVVVPTEVVVSAGINANILDRDRLKAGGREVSREESSVSATLNKIVALLYVESRLRTLERDL